MILQSVRGAALFAVLTVAACGPADTRGTGKASLQTFDYRNVSLKGGLLAEVLERTRQEYLHISNDGLLKGFRKRAGLPAPGPDMGGWYDKGTFNMFGQLLSGLARLYAATGDPACRDKSDLLVREWSKCIASDGFFFNTTGSVTAHYVYDKMVGGLVDNYVYCGNQEALDSLHRITQWAEKKLPRNHHGWNAEWYTLSENLYRAWLVTGDKTYRDFARVWEYPEYWDLFAEGKDIFEHRPAWGGKDFNYHAYSHVNTLSGAAAAHEVWGDPHYLKDITGAYEYLQDNQVFATGGYGPMEFLMRRKDVIGSLGFPPLKKHFETQCGSWAAFKLSKYLIRFTGEARYGDWIERLVYNAVAASPPMSPEGCIMYDSNYFVGGAAKENTPEPWSCCSGTRPQAVADIVDLVYFHGENRLCVNLFSPSRVDWPQAGTTVTLTQRTRFPESNVTEFILSLPNPVGFTLCVRVPGWADGPLRMSLNGRDVASIATATGWAEVRREWRDGDRLRVGLPMRLQASRMDAQATYPLALVDGPVVLAVAAQPGNNPASRIDPVDPSGSLEPVAEKPLHFRLKEAPSIEVKPFYEFKEGEPYFLYLDAAWKDRKTTKTASSKPEDGERAR